MLDRLRKSEFARNALTLMSGTLLAQFLPIAFSPVMTRIFAPTDYGVLGLYMAFAGIVNVLVTSQYNHAIMIAEREEDAANLVALCFSIAAAAATVVLLVVIVNNHVHPLVVFPNPRWLYLIPLSVLLSGAYTSLYYWTNRQKKYRRLAISRLGQSVVTIAVQITFGLCYRGPAGLILGLVAGQLTMTMLLVVQVWRADRATLAAALDANRVRELAAQHRSFVYYLLPADFVNSFNQQVPTLLLSKFAGTAEIGDYNFSQRILGLPSFLIASAIVDVFKQRAVSDYHRLGNCRDIYIKTFKTLTALGVIPLLTLVITAPTLFAFVFGSKWREAGTYAQLLSPLFFFRFVASPLSYIYYIVGKQREDLILHILMAAGTTVSLWLGHVLFGSAKGMIVLYSVNYSLIYVIYLVRSYTFSKGVAVTAAGGPV